MYKLHHSHFKKANNYIDVEIHKDVYNKSIPSGDNYINPNQNLVKVACHGISHGMHTTHSHPLLTKHPYVQIHTQPTHYVNNTSTLTKLRHAQLVCIFAYTMYMVEHSS